MLWGTLGARLLGNLFGGKGKIRAGEGTFWADEGTVTTDQDFWCRLIL